MSLRSERYLYLDLYHEGKAEPRDGEGVMADMEWIIEVKGGDQWKWGDNCISIAEKESEYENSICGSGYYEYEQWCLA